MKESLIVLYKDPPLSILISIPILVLLLVIDNKIVLVADARSFVFNLVVY